MDHANGNRTGRVPIPARNQPAAACPGDAAAPTAGQIDDAFYRIVSPGLPADQVEQAREWFRLGALEFTNEGGLGDALSPSRPASEREVYEQERRRLDAMTLEQAEAQISREVYQACQLYERMENRSKVRGNGHHMAQIISQAAVELLRERWTASQGRSDA